MLSGQQKLLKITLPSSQQLADNSKTIVIDPAGNRSNAQRADLIAVAPQTDAGTQGISYFFQTAGKNISTGMNITAWIAEPNSQTSGVMIPKSALLWAMDQAFVYVKTDNNTFSRRAITHYTLSNDGYFISEGLQPDEELVITGGQMLLSEEMRGQIPDED
jgi:Na+-transporting NADH:ubiquinone oxidoreductase subunit NqrC